MDLTRCLSDMTWVAKKTKCSGDILQTFLANVHIKRALASTLCSSLCSAPSEVIAHVGLYGFTVQMSAHELQSHAISNLHGGKELRLSS